MTNLNIQKSKYASRILYFDVLNVLACISVVCMHCNSYVHTFIKDEWWWMRVLIEVVCYFAVPVFFMLSGATLLNYREKYSTKVFLQKRLSRTFLPFLFWSFFFYFLYFINNGWDCHSYKEVLQRVLMGKIPYTNYWFFIPLFHLYIFIPFFALMREHMSNKQILSLCVLLLMMQSILPSFYLIIGLDFQMSLPIGSYVIYALGGYYLSHSKVEKNTGIMVCIGILAIVSMIIRYILIYTSETKDSSLFTYFGCYAVFPAVSIFLFIKRFTMKTSDIHSYWTFLSQRSFGVYLIHTFLIVLVGKMLSQDNPLFIPIAVILVYSLSIVIIFTMQKTPWIRHLVP